MSTQAASTTQREKADKPQYSKYSESKGCYEGDLVPIRGRITAL